MASTFGDASRDHWHTSSLSMSCNSLAPSMFLKLIITSKFSCGSLVGPSLEVVPTSIGLPVSRIVRHLRPSTSPVLVLIRPSPYIRWVIYSSFVLWLFMWW